MLEKTGLSESEVVTEVERYMVMPGQACAYKIGEIKMLELRTKAEKVLGDKFELHEFHNIVLGKGAMPLSLVEEMVDQYTDVAVDEV